MGITVTWDNEAQTVLRADLRGRWNLEEFRQQMRLAGQMVNSVSHPVSVVVDLTGSNALPDNLIQSVAQIVHGKSPHPPNVERYVIIGAGRFVQSLYRAFAKVYGEGMLHNKLVFVQTMDEARVIITTGG
jgi:hypothetical protein